MRLPHLFATSLLVAFAATPATAQIDMIAQANGAQDGTTSPFSASGFFTVDPVANTMAYNISVPLLTSPETAAHLHGPAAPGTGGGVLFALPVGSSKIGTWNYPESAEADILGGLVYLNIHSMMFPGGELRGQLTLVPIEECFCTDAVAPCANPFAMGGCAHSGPGPLGSRIVATGQASVALDSLQLTAFDAVPNQFGIIFMGPNAITQTFGDGLRCVGGGVHRFPIQNSGAAGAFVQGPGLVAFTQASFPASGRIQSGQTWRFQAWFRDPMGPCGSGFNTSNALSVTFTP